jgi:hypothetical protein
VLGDDEAGSGGCHFCAVTHSACGSFGTGFGNECDRSGKSEEGSHHFVEARRLASVGEEALADDAAEGERLFNLAGPDGEAGGAGRESLGGIEFAGENVVEFGDPVAAPASNFKQADVGEGAIVELGGGFSSWSKSASVTGALKPIPTARPMGEPRPAKIMWPPAMGSTVEPTCGRIFWSAWA